MTDEEMAEEYAKGLCKTCTVNTCRYNTLQTCAIKESLKQAHLAGLEAGRPKWHKVADGDVPKENGRFFVILENGLTKFSFYYPSEKKFTVWNKEYGSNIKLHNVVAWCEIPKYTEE